MITEGIDTKIELYEQCNELTMRRFIDCLCYNKLESLIKSGHPGKQHLNAAWNALLQEYLDCSSESDSRYLYTLENDISKKTLYCEAMAALINIIAEGYDIPGLRDQIMDAIAQVNELMDLELTITLHADTVETEMQQLRIIYNQWDMERGELEAEKKLASGEDKGGGKTPPTEQNYQQWASILRKNGYNTHINTTTVMEFVYDLNTYKQSITDGKRN